MEDNEDDGWAFEYKLQDYSQIKYISAQFDYFLKPMLINEAFFDKHFSSKESMMIL